MPPFACFLVCFPVVSLFIASQQCLIIDALSIILKLRIISFKCHCFYALIWDSSMLTSRWDWRKFNLFFFIIACLSLCFGLATKVCFRILKWSHLVSIWTQKLIKFPHHSSSHKLIFLLYKIIGEKEKSVAHVQWMPLTDSCKYI